MSIDIDLEELLTLGQAAHTLPRVPAPSTLWRWYRKGLNGVRLETVLVGGTRYTSREAVVRFASALTKVDEPSSPPDSDRGQATQRSPAMEKQLRDKGLLK